MTDREKLDCHLALIVTESEICKTCTYKHELEGERFACCFFALDCILHDNKDYRKEENK